MKKIWNAIVAGFKAIFCHETISKVWEILFATSKTKIGELLSDTELMNQAFEVSKALLTSDKTADEKRRAFDAELKMWARGAGRDVGTAALNAIRETAYAAVCAELEQSK